MMNELLKSIADLFQSSAGDDSGLAVRYRVAAMADCRLPLFLALIDEGGKIVASETLRGEWSERDMKKLIGSPRKRLGRRKTTIYEAANESSREFGVFATKLEGGCGCVLCGAVDGKLRSAGVDLRKITSAAAAWLLREKTTEKVKSETRIRQMQLEQQTLRMSREEAITSSIEQREERLREKEEHVSQLQAVMRLAADGIVTVRADGRVESFNQVASEILGYSSEEIVGKSYLLLFPERLRRIYERFMNRVHAGWGGGLYRPRGVDALRKDGVEVPVELSISEVEIGDRRIFTGIFRDVTRRKEAERELLRLHTQNELILQSAGEGILGIDKEGKLTFVNQAAARMFRCAGEELIGKTLHEMAHGASQAKEACPICLALRENVPITTGLDVFSRSDETQFDVEFTCTTIRDAVEGAGAVVTFRDITERRLLEAQLRQAQKLESIGQLAAGIAHEINTPTQYIGDNARFLQDAFAELNKALSLCKALAESEEPARREMIEEIATAAKDADVGYLLDEIPKALSQSLDGVGRVAKIVRSMKEFSHPGGEYRQLIDLNHAIESTITVSRNEWKYVAEMETRFDHALPLVACYPSDFNQVILNLIVNAAHAVGDKILPDGHEKGKIVVSTKADGDWAEIRVQDTGCGIPKEIQGRIYDPFFTTKPVGKGTGQGLAIAHSIIAEKHRGSITFETESGQGTTFIVRVPIGRELEDETEINANWAENQIAASPM